MAIFPRGNGATIPECWCAGVLKCWSAGGRGHVVIILLLDLVPLPPTRRRHQCPERCSTQYASPDYYAVRTYILYISTSIIMGLFRQ